MKKNTLVFLLFISISFCFFCSNSEKNRDWEEPFPERQKLVVIDSIGIEAGDSNYVFGSITDLMHSPDGEIMVLDMIHCTIFVFSPEGGFITRIGRRGDGPGEFIMPMYMTLLSDGSVAILDMEKTVTVIYDNEWIFSEEISPRQGLPPIEINGANENEYVGFKIDPEMENGQIVMHRKICLITEETERKVIYWEDTIPMNIEDWSSVYRDVIYSMIFTADRDGRVFFASYSSEKWHVVAMDRYGEILFEIDMNLPRFEKTDEEIADEKAYVESYVARTDDGLVIDWQPDPYRWMIRSLGVDRENRLWVERGTEIQPVFDIFDLSGTHLFTAEIDGYNAYGWKFFIDEGGILAFPEDTESFHKVYILQLQNL